MSNESMLGRLFDLSLGETAHDGNGKQLVAGAERLNLLVYLKKPSAMFLIPLDLSQQRFLLVGLLM